MHIQYKEQPVNINFIPYLDTGNTLLYLTQLKTNEYIETLTINMDIHIPKHIILLKPSENTKNIADILIQQGVIQEKIVGKYQQSNYNIYAYPLTDIGNQERLNQYKNEKYEEIIQET